MKGKIIIICDDRGTHLSVDVTDTEEHERIFIVHALGKSLGLEPIDYEVIAAAEAEGVLDGKGTPMAITIDTDELFKQLKEEADES